MRHLLVFMFCIGWVMVGSAQTRKIAHRSHGGQPSSFAMLMDDDHGGAYNPPPEIYHLEPWIANIRKHYEAQAKKIEHEEKLSAKVLPETAPADTVIPSDIQAVPSKPIEKSHKPGRKGKSSGASGPILDEKEGAEVIPFRLAKPIASSQVSEHRESAGIGLWWLAGALLLTVGPGVYWAAGKRV